MTAALTTRAHVDALADAACAAVPGLDRVTLAVSAEASDFLRFNQGALRQATHVVQGRATLGVVRGARRVQATLGLAGRLDDDVAALTAARTRLVALLPEVPEDPYLLPPDTVASGAREDAGALPDPGAVIDAVTGATRGLDFVGFHAGGPVVRAFADSRGQRLWHRVETFHLEGCLVRRGDQAIKLELSGPRWEPDAFARRVDAAAARLPLLDVPRHPLQPGAWRAYLAPAAMAELLGTLCWDGFGARAVRTGTSPLQRLASGAATLDPQVHLAEDTAHGLAPAFTADGSARPPRVALVDGGRWAGTLNAPRSAAQYGLVANGAEPGEAPTSLHLAAGTLPEAQVLSALDTGLWVSHLWYLNYADRAACRITGMTRFACFWVESGRLVAPLPPMRFDDSFLRMAGEGLVALTDRAECIPDSATYGERQLGSVTTPGALVEGWRLAL